jgi:topoisomerase-4 subunit A
VYYDAEQKYFYLKRFMAEETDKWKELVGEHKNSYPVAISLDQYARLEITYPEKSKRSNEIIEAEEFIATKGYSAKGKRLTTYEFENVSFIEPLKPDDYDSIDEESDNEEISSLFNLKDEDIFKKQNGTSEQTSLF